jgi:ribosomal-protein-alanine N-acetyltransferase
VTRIREAVSADMPVLETIQHATLASPWPELLDRAVHGDGVFCLVTALSQMEQKTEREIETKTELKTDLRIDTPVGYALALDGDQCYLAEIAVHPEYRRNGYGSELLKSVVDRTDTDEIRLTVRADDPTAKTFYETHDFSVIDRLPGHYDEGEETRDGLLLSKSLGS